MHHLVSKLIVYRKIGEDSILYRLAGICRDFEAGHDKEELAGRILTEINRMLDIATVYGFNGNLWHNYIAFLLAMTETPFTLVCEKHGASEGSVRRFVENDLEIFRQLLAYDFSTLEQATGLDCFDVIEHFQAVEKKEQIYNKSVSEKVQELSALIEGAKDGAEMFGIVTDFYKRYGVGMFGLNKAFRISPYYESGKSELLEAITTTGDMKLSDLVGYETQKQRLVENTEAFVEGRKANNVLLYGDAGTGKSTSIKAILNQFYDQTVARREGYHKYYWKIPYYAKQSEYSDWLYAYYAVDVRNGVVEWVWHYPEYETVPKQTSSSGGSSSGGSYRPSGNRPVTTTKKAYYDDDPYNARDFNDPEDFYDYYYDDFEDYEEAYDYFYEHNPD